MVEINQKPRWSFVVFPFLKTTGPVTIGHITLRSTDDIDQLDDQKVRQIREIADMLYLQDDLRIRSALYAVVPFIDLEFAPPAAMLEPLVRIHSLIAYAYSEPHQILGDPFLSTEHASIAIFSPGKIPLGILRPEHHVQPMSDQPLPPPTDDLMRYIDGYTGLYNFRHWFWVAQGSRLYGPAPRLTLNISQDLRGDFEYRLLNQSHLRLLLRAFSQPPTPTTERIFTAIRWYCAANATANDESVSLVNLAIAFEALLGFPDNDRRTERLVDSIALLLGRIPRLESWARQFYDVRSEIVHEGKTDRFRFIASDHRKGAGGAMYQPLLSYGRMIFRLCVGTLLTGAYLAENAGLQDRFVTNQERFVSICKNLSDTNVSSSERLSSISTTVDAVAQYRFLQEDDLKMETVLSAARLTAAALLDGNLTSDYPSLGGRLERLVSVRNSKDHYDELDALAAIFEGKAHLTVDSIGPHEHQKTAFRLLDTIWELVFRHYYWLKKSRGSAEGNGHS